MATPLLKRLDNLWTTYGLKVLPRPLRRPFPDWTEFEVSLVSVTPITADALGNDRELSPEKSANFRSHLCYFPEALPQHALLHGWFQTIDDYLAFADLVFAHRNRTHPYSVSVREAVPHITDSQIVALQKGWETPGGNQETEMKDMPLVTPSPVKNVDKSDRDDEIYYPSLRQIVIYAVFGTVIAILLIHHYMDWTTWAEAVSGALTLLLIGSVYVAVLRHIHRPHRR